MEIPLKCVIAVSLHVMKQKLFPLCTLFYFIPTPLLSMVLWSISCRVYKKKTNIKTMKSIIYNKQHIYMSNYIIMFPSTNVHLFNSSPSKLNIFNLCRVTSLVTDLSIKRTTHKYIDRGFRGGGHCQGNCYNVEKEH